MSQNLADLRTSYARKIAALGGVSGDARLEQAFASIPREAFLGPPAWRIFAPGEDTETFTTSDPAALYRDVLVALQEGGINNGQPSLHARCLSALRVQTGDSIVHVGAGSGYYTAIMAELTGPSGRVLAFEIDPTLALRAARNLAYLSQVEVHAESGSDCQLPACDDIYVSAGATGPAASWLDALQPSGRLLFPLTAIDGLGAMLLVSRRPDGGFDARFLTRATFIPCIGARSEEAGKRLIEAFDGSRWREVTTLGRGTHPPSKFWFAGPDWWLA